MTILGAIEICDRQKPNGYEYADKVHWLSQIDLKIHREIISRHEGGAAAFEGYAADADGEIELLADEAYADLYVKWLMAQIDFANAEMQRYNNSAAMFNALYEEYAAWYTREHRPLRRAYIKGARGRVKHAASETF